VEAWPVGVEAPADGTSEGAPDAEVDDDGWPDAGAAVGEAVAALPPQPATTMAIETASVARTSER
jgi:hypothetical protein